jgi:preprotein translocase subunit SecA
MQSSNGKSLVIGIASLIYALLGFEVHCCQKNDYLTERNRNLYQWLF